MVTGIGGLAAGIYSAIEIQSIKTAQAELRDHVQNLLRGLQEEHQKIVELTKQTLKTVRILIFIIFKHCKSNKLNPM